MGRRLRLIIAAACLVATTFAPQPASADAVAETCHGDGYMTTASGLFYPSVGPAVTTSAQITYSNKVGVCPTSVTLDRANCPVATTTNGYSISMVADAFTGQSCVSGAWRFFITIERHVIASDSATSAAAPCAGTGTMYTAAPVYYPVLGPDVNTQAIISYTTQTGGCPTNSVFRGNCLGGTLSDGSRVELQPVVEEGRSCVAGSVKFHVSVERA